MKTNRKNSKSKLSETQKSLPRTRGDPMASQHFPPRARTKQLRTEGARKNLPRATGDPAVSRFFFRSLCSLCWLVLIVLIVRSRQQCRRRRARWRGAGGTADTRRCGTGASSMQRRCTGASSRSKHCSEMAAETVAPTPPDCVLSSRMATCGTGPRRLRGENSESGRTRASESRLVRARERLADRLHVERLERAQLDQVDVEPLGLQQGRDG